MGVSGQVAREVKSARRELEGARADNVALVERLRYVQGYQASSRARNGAVPSPAALSRLAVTPLVCALADDSALGQPKRFTSRTSACADVESGQIENKYASAYEERMNPFSDWKEREKASRRRQLNMADRVMYEFGQFISRSQ